MSQLQRYQIGPGIGLTVVPTTRFKLSYMAANLMLPLAEETAGLGALLPEVLKAGGARGRLSLERELEELYGAILSGYVRKKGECQVASLVLQFPEARYTGDAMQLERSVKLLCGLLLNGHFTPAEVETEKRNLIDQIDAKLNDKRGYAVTQCIKEMCATEPYGTDELGEKEQVAQITAETLQRFYEKALRVAPIELFFVGSADADRLAEMLRAAFSSVTREERGLPVTTQHPAGALKEREEALPVSQGRLVLGFRTGITAADPRYPALALFNAIYGGAPTSKLFLNVREKLSLCYDVSSALEKVKGLMWVASGIRPTDREKAQHEILAQLEDMKAGNFTNEAVSEAVTIVTNSLRSAADSPFLTESEELTRLLAGGGFTGDALVNALKSVTKEQIVAAANAVKLEAVYFLNSSEVEG